MATALRDMVLRHVAPVSSMPIDDLAILFTLLLTQILPLTLGPALHNWSPALAQTLANPIPTIGKVLRLVLIGAIDFAQYETRAAIRLPPWLGTSMLLAASLCPGWFFGGSDLAKKKSMSLTSSSRNVAGGLVIAEGSLAGTPAVTAVVAYGLFSTPGTLPCPILFVKRSQDYSSNAAPWCIARTHVPTGQKP
jgi:BASS family bile acid:Na+ symporter